MTTESQKKVLLIFIQADSGVDGAASLDSASAKRSLFTSLKDSALSNIIRRAQFAIPPLAPTALPHSSFCRRCF